ncbi:MAG: beta-galactosidase, partial [Candidatus Omnitrophica bacterium]|nr:beta-galactosidase [Candidatus Omnitrophota bacterium]
MPAVKVEKRQIVVGKKKIPLISGEMHYWRLNPSSWEICLSAIRKMGINTVATYVPWFYHEYKRGKFDFTGRTDPCRNLKGFLDLLKRKKFWVIIRPGPYIYSESPNDGVPDYAYKYHRLHTQFLKYAANYMKKVCAVLRPYQATRRGGHIILLQADNEIDPWPDTFGHQYGFGKEPGLFQQFIQTKYGNTIDALNESWGSDYKSFNETGPYIVHDIKGDKGLRRHLDYYEF